jgi:hypothetical protein
VENFSENSPKPSPTSKLQTKNKIVSKNIKKAKLKNEKPN